VQPDEPSGRAQLRRVIDSLRPRIEQMAELLETAEAEPLRTGLPGRPLPPVRTKTSRSASQGDPGAAPTGSASSQPRQPAAPVHMLLAKRGDEWQDSGRYFRLEAIALIGPSQRGGGCCPRRSPGLAAYNQALAGRSGDSLSANVRHSS
jgi:hypothetical protein